MVASKMVEQVLRKGSAMFHASLGQGQAPQEEPMIAETGDVGGLFGVAGPTILTIAGGRSAEELACLTNRFGGQRIEIDVASAPQWLQRRIGAVDLVWVGEAAANDTAALDAVDAYCARTQCRLAVAVGPQSLDALFARFGMRDDVDLIIDPDAASCLFAFVQAGGSRAAVLHDPTRAAADSRIDQLEGEVARIVQMLSLLRSGGSAAGYPLHDTAPVQSGDGFGDGLIGYPAATVQEPLVRAPVRGFNGQSGPMFFTSPTVDGAFVRKMIRQRRLRDRFFPADIFADPAWDMLLDLFAARLERRSVSVSSLCIASAVPATTALRWIKSLTDAGIFVREADPHDGRRIFITLSEGAEAGMRAYCDAMAGA
jgi:hypothetical protein